MPRRIQAASRHMQTCHKDAVCRWIAKWQEPSQEQHTYIYCSGKEECVVGCVDAVVRMSCHKHAV